MFYKFMDFRTQMVWCSVAYKHYNRYTIGQALLNAVRWGLPSVLYTDWGKPEKSNYVTLLMEQLTGLGVAIKERLKKAKPDVLILHPGPINRGVELASDVADGPQSSILRQVSNGLAIRMAILFLLNQASQG